MECASSASVDHLESLSDDDEVALLAECIERQMELPAVSENFSVPPSSSKQEVTRAATPKLTYIPGPMFDACCKVFEIKERSHNQQLQLIGPNGRYARVAPSCR